MSDATHRLSPADLLVRGTFDLRCVLDRLHSSPGMEAGIPGPAQALRAVVLVKVRERPLAQGLGPEEEPPAILRRELRGRP